MPWLECQCPPSAQCPQGRDPARVKCVVWRVTPEKMGLTERQEKALAFIRSYIAENNIPPSITEICEHTGFRSKGRVHEIIVALKARGHIDYRPRMARSIKVL